MTSIDLVADGVKLYENDKIKMACDNLSDALKALERVVALPVDQERSVIDATTQRFKIAIELFWKFLKLILESKDVLVSYPRDVLKEAYSGGLIEDENLWLSMLKDRNMSSHTYNQELADDIYLRIKQYVPSLKEAFEKLKI